MDNGVITGTLQVEFFPLLHKSNSGDQGKGNGARETHEERQQFKYTNIVPIFQINVNHDGRENNLSDHQDEKHSGYGEATVG